jgi:N-acetylmuramoyl-L-alanine amidase CwlA
MITFVMTVLWLGVGMCRISINDFKEEVDWVGALTQHDSEIRWEEIKKLTPQQTEREVSTMLDEALSTAPSETSSMAPETGDETGAVAVLLAASETRCCLALGLFWQ